mgnify:CR=1 FL=1
MLLCGEIHYFRVPKDLWLDRLLKLKMAGFNCVNVYLAWNYHEVKPGVFDISGEKDFTKFFEIARNLGLYIIARVGPYMCAEWDNGGHPDWLIKKDFVPRSLDPSYFPYAERWLRFVLPLVIKEKNVVGIQLENEYFWGDVPYHMKLKEIAKSLGVNVTLYTNMNRYVRNTDFVDTLDLYPDPWDISRVISRFNDIMQTQPFQNLKIMEYEGGWFSTITKPLPTERGSFPPNWTKMLFALAIAYGADLISFYMFHGGTSFNPGRWITTTYDYEASVREWGELSERYYKLKLLAPVAYLLEGSKATYESVNEKRIKIVREKEEGKEEKKVTFYINNTDEVWNDGSVTVPPRDVKIVPNEIKIGEIKISSNINLLNVLNNTVLLYDLPNTKFFVKIEGEIDNIACYNVENATSNLFEGIVKEKDISGCVITSNGNNYRVLVLPQFMAERTWFLDNTFIISNVYLVRDFKDKIIAEVKEGENVIFVPFRSSKGEYIKELGISRIKFNVKIEDPKITINSIKYKEISLNKPIMKIDKLLPLEELGIYDHDYYVYSTELKEDSDIYVRVNDHAVILNNGKVIASGFLSIYTKAERGKLDIIVESTGHPNGPMQVLAPFFTGLLALLLRKIKEIKLDFIEYGIIDLSDRFNPGIATYHSHTYLINKEIREYASKVNWQKEIPKVNIMAGILYAKAKFISEKKPGILKINSPSRVLFVIIVNGVEVYRGADNEIYIDPSVLKEGENEIIIGIPLYNEIPQYTFDGSITLYEDKIESFTLSKFVEVEKEVTNLEGPSVIAIDFEVEKGDINAPLYLEIDGDINAQIYLNGKMVGKYYGKGSQTRFYLPEPYLSNKNEIKLLAVPLKQNAEIRKINIGTYFKTKIVEIET